MSHVDNSAVEVWVKILCVLFWGLLHSRVFPHWAWTPRSPSVRSVGGGYGSVFGPVLVLVHLFTSEKDILVYTLLVTFFFTFPIASYPLKK